MCVLKLSCVTIRNVGYESRRYNVILIRSPPSCVVVLAKASVNSNKHCTCLHQSSSSNGGYGGGSMSSSSNNNSSSIVVVVVIVVILLVVVVVVVVVVAL